MYLIQTRDQFVILAFKCFSDHTENLNDTDGSAH